MTRARTIDRITTSLRRQEQNVALRMRFLDVPILSDLT